MSILGAPALFDVNGALETSVSAIARVSCLKPYDSAGKIVVASAPLAPIRVTSGLPLNSDGSLYIVSKAAAVAPFAYLAGLKYDANGAIVVTTLGDATAPLSTFGKLIRDATGAIVVTAGGGDPFFANVSLLLHFDGTNGSTTITDSSSNNHSFSTVGNATLTTSEKKFGTASLNMDGTGDGIIGPTGHPSFNFGSGDFTIEGFIKFGQFDQTNSWITNRDPAGVADAGFLFGEQPASGRARFYAWNPAGTLVVNLVTPSIFWGSSIFHYLAVRRSGNTFTIWLDGTQHATTTYSGAIADSPYPLVMGYDPVGAGDILGKFDEWRVTKGVARALNVVPTLPFPSSA